MKYPKINFILILAFVLMLGACKNSNEVDPVASVKGRWIESKYEQKIKPKGGNSQSQSEDLSNTNNYMEFDGLGGVKISGEDGQGKTSVSEAKYNVNGNVITIEYQINATSKYTEEYSFVINGKNLTLTQNLSQLKSYFNQLKPLVKDDKDASDFITAYLTELNNLEIFDTVLTLTKN
jgi:hypothetical protein